MDIFDLKISGDLHIKTLCRLCLTVVDDANIIPIFSARGVQNVTLDERIRECINVEVSECDGLPPNVCDTCANKVTEWHDFKQNAKRSDLSLRQLLLSPPTADDDNSCSGASVDLVIKTEAETSTDVDSDDEDDDVPLSKIFGFKKFVEFGKNRTRLKKSGVRKKTRGRAPKVKPFCEECNVKFLHFPEYEDHQREVHGLDTAKEELPGGVDCEAFVIYRCHICKEEFENRGDLRAHCTTKHNVKVIHPYGCSHCDRQFPSWSLLIVHERQHTGEKPYNCDMCGKDSFISLASLRRHKLMHLKVYNCKQCGRDFNCDSALKAHIRCKHTDEKPFLCNICGRSFSLATILNAHMTSHSSERKYKCEICGFRSKTSGNHHRHRARHNQGGAKTFHCETCGKAFDTKLKLSSHQIIHKTVRPHVCKLCGKGFLYNNKLERHVLLVHARERPFPCPICNRKLASKFGLGIHLKTHNKADDVPSEEVEPNQSIILKIQPEVPHHSDQVQEIRLLIQ